MLHSKKLLLLLSASIMAASLAHAAVRSIADVDGFSDRNAAKTTSVNVSSDGEGGHTSTYSGVECGDKSADTPEGCNLLLGISNAIATACDGGRYNCSEPSNPIPLGAYPTCDADASADKICSSPLQREQCISSGGELLYHCRCSSEYKKCSSADLPYGDINFQCADTTGTYYKECLPACSSSITAADTASGCQYQLNRDFAIKCYDLGMGKVRYDCAPACSLFEEKVPQYSIQEEAVCTSAPINGEGKAFCYEKNTKKVVCGCSTNDYVENCGKEPICSGDEFPLGTPICTAEKDLDGGICEKMSNKCGYGECRATNMTTLNIIYDDLKYNYGTYTDESLKATAEDCSLQGSMLSSNKYTQFAGKKVSLCSTETTLTFEKNADGSTSTATATMAAVCSCKDDYKYTSFDATDSFLQEHGLQASDRAPAKNYVSPISSISKSMTVDKKNRYVIGGICGWDAQTSKKSTAVNISVPNMSTGTSGQKITGTIELASGMDLSKLRYQNAPIKICETWEEDIIDYQNSSEGKKYAPVDNQCSGGGQFVSCARKIDLTGVDIVVDGGIYSANPSMEYYEKVSYCACPKDESGNDLWHTTCSSGELRGGRQCTLEGAVKFELCLPQCQGTSNASDGPRYVDLNSSTSITTSCDNISQTIFGQFDNGADADNSSFYEQNKSSLCLKEDAASDEKVFWQCNCGNFKSEEDCRELSSEGIGNGKVCMFDSRDNNKLIKYETCQISCSTDKKTWLEEDKLSCQYGNYNGGVECYLAGSDGAEGQIMYQCHCPEYMHSLLEECGGQITDTQTVCDSDCQTCYLEEKVGLDEACVFDSLDDNGDQLEYLKKYGLFGTKCSWLEKDSGEGNLFLVDRADDCNIGISGTALTTMCYEISKTSGFPQVKYICNCPKSYKTEDEYCKDFVAAGNVDATGKPYTEESCKASIKGIGNKCSYDTVDGVRVDKYKDFGIACPAEGDNIKNDASECNIGDYEGISTRCYKDDNNGFSNVICNCPKEFGTECDDDTEIRGGLSCSFDGETKYEKCLPKCHNTSTTPVVSDPSGCPLVGGVQADAEEMCFSGYGDTTAMYICRCPKGEGYKTLEEYCRSDQNEAGVFGVYAQGRFFTASECERSFVGIGEGCTFDGDGVVKYKSFSTICPKDRPLFYSASECSSGGIKGSLDYYCYENSNLLQQRVVCKCPDTWVDINGNREVDGTDTKVCSDTEEAAGQTCNLEGNSNLKYEKCYPRCDKLDTNGHGISYLEEGEASDLACRNLLGNGATFGTDGNGEECSKEHKLQYPCYCSSAYAEECSSDNNQIPAPGMPGCRIGDTTYYTQCINKDCSEESSTIAIIDDVDFSLAPTVLCQNAGFGSGVSGKRCGENKVECSCNAREYTEICEYPNVMPDVNDVLWCKYGNNGTLMKNGVAHFLPGACIRRSMLAECGKYVLDSDGSENTSYTIHVAPTESQCEALYGTGVQTQLCEYADDPNKRAYNCYYDPSAFIWTEDNCPVRRLLGEKYIIKNGVRYHDKCDCHPAYANHRYNCAGILSGGICKQELTAAKVNSDSTLREAVQNNWISIGDPMSYYPYCQCPEDYNQECDGERYIGVGTPCNGKYKSCECKPDELPMNWADNYYGCPGGKRPTGVTKPNGCGGKYYQCEASECTWQHTEKCYSPLIGIDSCQDNEGNIVAYKSCQCPSGYIQCPEGTVGTGEPCMLNGQYYYKEGSCISKDICTQGESETCLGSLQIGVNPCTRNDVTYFEYCVCASGYDKTCNGDNEVGVGVPCNLNGTNYYTECANPSDTCTNEHKEACDTNQSSYDPCVSEENKIMYKCKCPANWKKCETEGPASGAETCTDSNGTYYSSCAVVNECTSYQEKTYSVCNEYQIGMGGSCISTEGDTQTIKYAQCEDSSVCRLNGYQYSCQGYDQGGLGDYCVDERGNRLYKSCDCPSNWVECPSKNNVKGRSCTPLTETGTLGTTVYESCTCDKSIYNKTCEATETNRGIIPAEDNSCTAVIYGEGEQPTYYAACACDSKYKYTCTANGQTEDEENYCQKEEGGEKLYSHCECSEEYSETCEYDSNNPGLSNPEDNSQSCTPLNSETGDNTTKYLSCECGQYYTETCSEPNQLKENKYKCSIDDIDRYNQCNCSSEFVHSCQPSGQNKGVTTPTLSSSQSCNQIKYVNGVRTTTTLYSECQCQISYRFSCDPNDDDGQGFTNMYSPASYYVRETNYCEKPASKGSTTMQRRYEACICNPSFKTECKAAGESIPVGAISCVQVDKNGQVKTLYQECGCGDVDMTGYTSTGITVDAAEGSQSFTKADFNKLSTSIQTNIKNVLNAGCTYYKNANLKLDGCGRLYYRCILTGYPYYEDSEWDINNCSSSEGGLQGDSKTVQGTLGTVVMYESCGSSSTTPEVDLSGFSSTGIIVNVPEGSTTFGKTEFSQQSSSIQNSIKNKLNAACRYYKNTLLTLDGQGTLYYRCIDTKYLYYIDPQDGSTNCSLSGGAQGESNLVYGSLGYVTMYSACGTFDVDLSDYTYSGVMVDAPTGSTTFGETEFNQQNSGTQISVKNRLNTACTYYKNAYLKLDGSGNLYYKCIDTTRKYYIDSEEGDATNCKEEGGAQGDANTVNGSLGTVTMYKSCGTSSGDLDLTGYTFSGLGVVNSDGDTEFDQANLAEESQIIQENILHLLNSHCGYYKNADLKVNFINRLYYKCINTTYDYYLDEEDGDITNCSDGKTLQGGSQRVNGSLGNVVMYEECSCDKSKFILQSCSEGYVCEQCDNLFAWDGKSCEDGYKVLKATKQCAVFTCVYNDCNIECGDCNQFGSNCSVCDSCREGADQDYRNCLSLYE